MGADFSYGGQAVIEGVMMRGRKGVAIAVRSEKDGIITKEQTLKLLAERFPVLGWPIIRGSVALVETLIIGIRALNFSASMFMAEEEEELGAKELVMTLGLAFLLTVGIFIAIPAFAIRYVQASVHSNVLLNLIEGAIKISLFILYIKVISYMPDIKRVFEYHGAEHKTINCYEAGEELTVANVQKYSTVHKRCGTNFILVVLLTSIFVFSFFGRPPFVQRVLIHLAVLPLVGGLSYEVIKRAGKKHASPFILALVTPGLWLQRLTTRQPDDSQVEVAIKSLQTVLSRDRQVVEFRRELTAV